MIKTLLLLVFAIHGPFLAGWSAPVVFKNSSTGTLWFFAEINEELNEGHYVRCIFLNEHNQLLEQIVAQTASRKGETDQWELRGGYRLHYAHASGEILRRVHFEEFLVTESIGCRSSSENTERTIKIQDGVLFFHSNQNGLFRNAFLFTLPKDSGGYFVHARELEIENEDAEWIELVEGAIHQQSRSSFGSYSPPLEFSRTRIIKTSVWKPESEQDEGDNE